MKKKIPFVVTALLVIGTLGVTPGIAIAQIKPRTAKTASTPAQSTVTTFQTDNYSVRVFRTGDRTRMNLFDKRTNQMKLNAVPVQVQRNGQQTSYSTSHGNANYLISVDGNGSRSVQILSPNESIQESVTNN